MLTVMRISVPDMGKTEIVEPCTRSGVTVQERVTSTPVLRTYPNGESESYALVRVYLGREADNTGFYRLDLDPEAAWYLGMALLEEAGKWGGFRSRPEAGE